jgi:pimeloyl-ACP methyl ester carboxylesterase
MNEHFLAEEGIYYRTNDFVKGRQTLVFVHGLSGSASAWKPYEELYKGDYNILTYDLRGHGKSRRHAAYHEYEITKFVEDLHRLIQKLGIEKCVLISHSFGTLVGIQYLLAHGERVQKAVFLSPNFAVGGVWLKLPLYLGIGLYRLFAPLFKKWDVRGGHVDYTHYIGTGDWNIRRTYADVRNTGFLEYLYATKQTLKFNVLDQLSTITAPVLLVHGKKDTIFRYTNSLTIAKKIPHAKVVLLPKANHILVLNYFSEVSRVLSEFFKG